MEFIGSPFEQLPADVLIGLFSLLSPPDLAPARLVCSAWQAKIDSRDLWLIKYFSDWKISSVSSFLSSSFSFSILPAASPPCGKKKHSLDFFFLSPSSFCSHARDSQISARGRDRCPLRIQIDVEILANCFSQWAGANRGEERARQVPCSPDPRAPSIH